MSTFFSSLATHINDDFKAVLPVINTIVSDMVSNDAAWNASPVVKSTEAVAALVSPIAAVDAQAVIGAVSLVQALWQTFGGGSASIQPQAAVSVSAVSAPQAATTTPIPVLTQAVAGPGVASDLHVPEVSIAPTPAIPQVSSAALEDGPSHM